jgi:hypothetical protein
MAVESFNQSMARSACCMRACMGLNGTDKGCQVPAW